MIEPTYALAPLGAGKSVNASFQSEKNQKPAAIALQQVQQSAAKTPRWQERVANTGGITIILGSLFLLTSPLTAKKLNHPKMNRDALERLAWKIIGYGGLLQMIDRYKTAINTKQPSIFLSEVMCMLMAIGFIVKPKNVIVRSIGFIAGALWLAGKRNDIGNSVDLAHRREWDMSRLLPFSEQDTDQEAYTKRLKNELSSAGRFIWKDLKDTLSINPLNIFKPDKPKDYWKTPQADQLAIGAQFSLLAGLTAQINPLLPGGSMAAKGLQILNKSGALISEFANRTPVTLRAWENRHEPDGWLILMSTPIQIVGRLFQTSSNYGHLNSLLNLGSAISTKGLLINSQKRMEMLNYLKSLHSLAVESPDLTAASVRESIEKDSALRKQMQQTMGELCVTFILDTLKQAEQSKLPLTSCLESILASESPSTKPKTPTKQSTDLLLA